MLLTELQRDSRQTVQQLAERVSLSSTPVWKRIKEIEAAGVLRGYTAMVDREKVGLGLCVKIMFKLPGVTHVRSSVVLKEIKSDSRLPLELPKAASSDKPARSARRTRSSA